MKHTKIIAGIIVAVALIGAGGWYLASSLQADQVAGESMSCGAHSAESTNMFATIRGDEFDKAFIVDMLAHHEGAVSMAEAALAATERPEVRELSSAIINTQSNEIVKMRAWQTDWGYPVEATDAHAGHGGSPDPMAHDMEAMNDSLVGLTGADFDEMFLRQMIEHHQQAVDMSKYADANAKHEEIKSLAAVIITAQQDEINTMQQWQESWGFEVTEGTKPQPVENCSL